MPPVLLSRGLDPLLGVFTGVLAYYLYETHPRNNMASDERLMVLLEQKYARYRGERRKKLQSMEDMVWSEASSSNSKS
ncbi:uncharacterized protein LACBIDRAFT_306043 [Laccaria bicolor S238N-H82]|uniref:Predicted protein n=1 Tax=Laccaria bicolor (strain S238N-H82 / ATCC MYA-4686) TaxID=486041 RepID=B0CSK9_LACBS|nr:uncharacterized protein LACBIDRAFT_306043 [Laccaria bicolor S238N-H82]EDR14325.1 predicted protein [Laccaria bicolor S238N-H82]|eukprot:XP_001874884.1 predicted protein [Laccaria bicolor S238N-H82]